MAQYANTNADWNAAIRQDRLLLKEDVFIGPSNTKLVEKYTGFIRLKGAGLKEAVDNTKDELVLELHLHQLEVDKTVAVGEACGREILQYSEIKDQMETEIAATRKEISALQARLDAERRVRRNREECEALAAIANAHPASRATKRKIDEIRGGLDVEMDKAARTTMELELREKQFALCLQSIFDLKSVLAENTDATEKNSMLGNGQEK